MVVTCDQHANASWATNTRDDPDASRRSPHGQLGACERVSSASQCCRLCAHTLGCLAWTFAGQSSDVPFVPREASATRCCMKFHRPRHRAYEAPGCVAGVLRSAPCVERCQLPLGLRSPLAAIGTSPLRPRVSNASHYPWLLVQQARQRQARISEHVAPAVTPPPKPARVAVCIAGTTRSLIHPTIWRSIEHNVLGRAHGARAGSLVGYDVFAVLSTGPEDSPHAAAERAKTYTPRDDLLPRSQWRESFVWRSQKGSTQAPRGGSWEAAAGHAELLARALTGLRPRAVRLRTEPANISCGLPSSAQFARWADCVELIEAHEERMAAAVGADGVGGRGRADAARSRVPLYDAMLKIRTDGVHKYQVVGGASLGEMAANLEAHTIATSDDLLVLVQRADWHVLRAMRPGPNSGLRCPRHCNQRDRPAFPGLGGYEMPTHCLMRSHFARYDTHLVDMGLMLPVEELLVDTSVRGAHREWRSGVGVLAPPTQILRLRPTRDVQREGNLARAHDWEGAAQPLVCEPLHPPARDTCAPYLPTFRCGACGAGSSAPCPPAVDLFPSLHAQTRPPVRSSSHAACAACCLNVTCTSPGCIALADAVPADQNGNPFSVRRGPGVQERSGRAVACGRVLRPLLEAGILLGSTRNAKGELISAHCRTRRCAADDGGGLTRASSAAEHHAALDLELIHAACALDDPCGQNASSNARSLAALLRPLGKDVPPAMASARFFEPADATGWTAHFVLQLFEGEVVRRLVQLADRQAVPKRYAAC